MKNFNAIFLGNAFSIPEFLLFMAGLVVVMAIVFALISHGAVKSKEIAKNVKIRIDQKKQQNLLNESIDNSMREYREYKNSFQYFSNNKLLDIYEQFQNGTKSSNMEQMALEEELIKRKMIDHSPMHEKLYAINKEFF